MASATVRASIALVLMLALLPIAAAPARAQAVATKWTQIGSGIINDGRESVAGHHNMCGRVIQAAWRMDVKQGKTILWVATSRGGVWKSIVDLSGNITHWAPLTDNFAGPHGTGSFLVHRLDSNYILVGPGGFASGSGDGKIYRTTNQGGAWTGVKLPLGVHQKAAAHVTRIVDDRSDATGNTVLACTSDGIYKSTDFGVSWHQVFQGLSFGETDEVTDLFQDAGNASIWYAGALTPHAILRSTSHGDGGTWATFTGSSAIGGSIGRVSLTQCAASPTVMYALVSTLKADSPKDGDLNGIYRSMDRGKNWTPICVDNSLIDRDSQALHTCAIACDPTNPKHLIAGMKEAVEIFNATTILPLANLWPATVDAGHDDYNFFLFKPGTHKIFVSCDGGIYTFNSSDQSVDDSLCVLGINAMFLERAQGSLASSNSDPDEFVAGLVDNGDVVGSAAHGTLKVFGRGDGGQISIAPEDRETVAASGTTFNAGGDRDITFTLGQSDWFKDQHGLDDDNFSSMLLDPTPGINVPLLFTYSQDFLGISNVYVRNSLDLISNWTLASGEGLFGSLSHIDHTTDPATHEILMTLDGQRKLFALAGPRANLGALDLIDVTPPLPALISGPNAHANADRSAKQHQTIYYTTAGSRPSRAFVSTDGGQHWLDVTGDLPTGLDYNKLVGDPRDLLHLFLATSKGAYRTDTGGFHWYKWSTGLRTNENVQDIVVNSDHVSGAPTIYVATDGRGFYQRLVK